MSDIVLSAGVRQNLLALQTTAQLMSVTQNRLATGKRINSALDNPTNFFTSQSLSNRASDLNALLDSIGQAQKTLEATDKGISSLTKLVESAKAILRNARQAPLTSAISYGAINVAGSVATGETLGTTGDGAAIAVADSTTYSFDININGAGPQTVTYTSGVGATYNDILTGLQASFATALTNSGVTGSDAQLVANSGGDGIKVDALNSDIDFDISANSGAGLTNNTYNSTSLFDTTGAGTLDLSANGGATQSITIGTGVGEVSTLAELNTALAGLSNITGSASATTVNLSVAGSTIANSLTIGGTAAVLTELGLSAGTTNGVASVPTPDPTRTSLQSDYNDVLTQIDQLAGDASYNGINLLNSDNLLIIFNELGTSTYNVSGVNDSSAGLGLAAVTGTYFQTNTNIDAEIGNVDKALATLRAQATKFGSTLSTVLVRQEFTKNLVNTLQTGSDKLVLADTNEEGANMLALQTRQQLSTTALSLAAQADQAVLRLF